MSPHIPVLLNEVLTALTATKGGLFIDGTFGAGGYTQGILDAAPDARVIAFDRDISTAETARRFKEKYADRFMFVQDCFSHMQNYITQPVDGIVLDLGVSSMQLDQPERGFSFRFDGPLDMRMGLADMSASDVVNTFSEAELADILFEYGEEKASYRIARAIIQARQNQKITTTLQLADIIHHVMPKPKDGSDSAMRSFQALRIFVNDELGELKRTLNASVHLLKPAGRLVVVSFHSLEDRIVKNFLIQNSDLKPNQNRYLPETSHQPVLFRVITKKPVLPTEGELQRNSRSHSARLRCGGRTGIKG